MIDANDGNTLTMDPAAIERADPSDLLAQLISEHDQLGTRLRELTKKLEVSKSGITRAQSEQGEAIADGIDARAITARIRNLEVEAEGLKRGIVIVTERRQQVAGDVAAERKRLATVEAERTRALYEAALHAAYRPAYEWAVQAQELRASIERAGAVANAAGLELYRIEHVGSGHDSVAHAAARPFKGIPDDALGGLFSMSAAFLTMLAPAIAGAKLKRALTSISTVAQGAANGVVD